MSNLENTVSSTDNGASVGTPGTDSHQTKIWPAGPDAQVAGGWAAADLAVAVREYLDLPVAVADTERAGRDPELHGLLKVVRANPGSESAVRDWATSSLPPERREAFATAWRDAVADAVAAARDAATRDSQNGPQNRNGATGRHQGDTPAGAAEAAGKAAEARVVAGRLDARPLAGPYKPTDIGNGERLAHKFGTGVRYCHPWGKWLYWDGRRWDRDRLGVLSRCAKRTARAIATEEMTLTDPDDADSRSSLGVWARKSEDYKRVTAMIRLAASEPGIPVLPEDLDTDPWLLNCRNCTLDLRRNATTLVRPHTKSDLITKLSPTVYDPDAQCPNWLATLQLVFADNARLIRYWRQLCGLALTGVTDEQILPILYGTGRNGKSTLIGAMLGMLGGDYAIKAPQNFLMVKHHESHPTELADLHGKRLVAAVETGEHARINEVLVKELTGKDPIRARRMREDFWEFLPSHHVWLGTNHRPGIRGTDLAIWRRIREIPFTVAIPEDRVVKDMDRRLAEEYSGILNWCLEGVLDWQAAGLITPDEVSAATAEYKLQQDILAQFFASACVLASPETRAADAGKPPGKIAIKVNAKRLHAAFNNWLGHNTSRGPLAPQDFKRQMSEHGYETVMNNSTRTLWYVGVGLQQEDPAPLQQAGQTSTEGKTDR